MSTAAMRSLSGPITIGEFPPNESFADRLARAGFFVPDQAYMRHLMMVTSLNLGWNASAANIDVARRNPPKAGWVPFRDFTLEHYGHVQRGQMGAPMPQEVSSHIAAVSSQFPEAKVEILAHPADDPFVQFELDGEKVMTMAWRRYFDADCDIYPSIR